MIGSVGEMDVGKEYSLMFVNRYVFIKKCARVALSCRYRQSMNAHRPEQSTGINLFIIHVVVLLVAFLTKNKDEHLVAESKISPPP
jgi:hypothetical protein